MTAPRPARAKQRVNWAGVQDVLFRNVTMAFGLLVLALIALIGVGLFRESALTRRLFGLSLLRGSTWDIVHDVYGALPFIYGTLVTSVIALVVAVPLGLGSAILLAEIAPRWIATPVSFVIEMLAAVPSVIFGLWGFLVLCPWLQAYVYPWLTGHFGSIPLFAPPAYPTNFLTAGLILAMMVLPFITAVSREVIRTVPASQREAALGLGATRWETIRSVVLAGARSGIVGAIILALGRAVGETMAVVMVIGNNPQISKSLLQPGYTLPALLANQFNESQNIAIQRSALIEVALILFMITLLINGFARLLILLSARGASSQTQSARASKFIERIKKSSAAGFRFVLLCGLAVAAIVQTVADLRTRGAGGLAGPVEAIALVGAALWAANRYLGGTRFWTGWRKLVNVAMTGLVSLCAVLACVMLGLLLAYVCGQGVHGINGHFFTGDGSKGFDPSGGMANGIVGTCVLVALASALGIPIGIMGGIFLSEFRTSRARGIVRFAADVLNGIPSVVVGMFAYAVFVLPFGHFSAWAGGAALGIMMIPTVVRTTEEMLLLVPVSLREAALGLGATRARMVIGMVLPAARAGIITGVLLAIARIAGETAPLLFTAFGNDYVSTKLSEPISSMTMMIYRYAMSGYSIWEQRAWTGALMLVALVLLLSLAARLATRTRYALR